MSTDMIAYLNYMSTWDSESDENVDALITEHRYFLNVGNFDSNTVVNNEFDMLHKMACEVRDTTIAGDVVQMVADAAAVASIWSFGFGMAFFAAAEVSELAIRSEISSKSTSLNNKLETTDMDIAKGISDDVKNYVAKYKANNILIAAKAPKGLDTRTCRANLMQFMAEVEKTTDLNAANFKMYASSARRVFESNEIGGVYDALDNLNMSAKSDADIDQFIRTLTGFTYPDKFAVNLVRGFSIAIMSYKLKITNIKIAKFAEEAGIPIEEINESTFEVMDCVGKFVTVIAVIMSVVDIVLQIFDIVDIVDQCKTMCDKLDGDIKKSYLKFFDGMREASKEYKDAIAKHQKNRE